MVKVDRASAVAAWSAPEGHEPAGISEVGDKLNRRRVSGLSEDKVESVAYGCPMLVQLATQRPDVIPQLAELPGQIVRVPI
jgi:hypothetical protein